MCLSRGQLKCYIKLTVSWKTHRDEEIIERTALPDELIKMAEGVVVVQDQQTRVRVRSPPPPPPLWCVCVCK